MGIFSPPFFLFTFANLLLNLLLLYLFAKTRRKEKCQASPFWLSVWWCYFFLNNLKFSSTVIQFPIDSNTLFRMQKKMKKTHYREKKIYKEIFESTGNFPTLFSERKKEIKFIPEIVFPKLLLKLLGGREEQWLFDYLVTLLTERKFCEILCYCVIVCVSVCNVLYDMPYGFGMIQLNTKLFVLLLVNLNAWIYFKIEYFMKRSHLIWWILLTITKK